MKKYMVVYSTPDEESVFEPGTIIKGSTGSSFFDDLSNAQSFAMDCCCGLGGRAQVYVWKEATEENDFDGDYYEYRYRSCRFSQRTR